RTTRRAVVQDFQRALPIEPAALNERDSFRQRGGLHAAKIIVDQLHKRTAASGPNVNDVAAHHFKNRPYTVNGRSIASHKELKVAGSSMYFAARQRCIQELATMLGDNLRQLSYPGC